MIVITVSSGEDEEEGFTVITTGIGNTRNLPLVVGSVCHRGNNAFGPDCQTKGVTYVSSARWVAVILEDNVVDDASRPPLIEEEWPGIEEKENEHSNISLITKVFNSIDSHSQTTLPDFNLCEEGCGDDIVWIACLGASRVVRKMRLLVEHTLTMSILQPPTIASLLAIVFGVG
ncbi:hypothetical protein RJ641_003392 [Dillenia turbinata]|uniref:Uncharacterized protein n=1 Tax=Dillenia turbinata TaxID=194707 RepID=A0AAN8VDQ3_9MAGN